MGLFIEESKIKERLSIERTIDANEEAFKLHFTGEAKVPERLVLGVPEYQGATLFKPALLPPPYSCFAVKVVSVRPRNAAVNLPTVPATIMLFSSESGLPLAHMDGTYLTGLRTAAASAIATKLWASVDSGVLVVFGAGLQAELHVRAILHVRPSIHTIVLINRSGPRVVALQHQLQAEFPATSIESLSLAGEDTVHYQQQISHYVKQADIIVTATNSSTPLFCGADLKPGCHVNSIGSYRPDMQEVDADVVCRSACIAVDCVEAMHTSGDLLIPLQAQPQLQQRIHVLGEILTQPHCVTRNPDDISYFKSVGTAVQDVMTAYLALKTCFD